MRKRSEIEQQVIAARAQAQAFVRSSRLEAEARARELTDLAHSNSPPPSGRRRRSSATPSRRRGETQGSKVPLDREKPVQAREAAPSHNPAPTEEGRINRVDHGRKFGRPQT